eukprot:GFUD01039020.1.p1 GENE.GFUD01039020.1~~GFUD01039020.1.p1  ORF type:complete len:503 (-),score=224.51 GFUD01039020.1:44-1552(-)
MFDIKAKEKLRNKVNKQVELRMKETGATDEKLVRIEINKELRAKRKEKKASNHEEVDTIKAEVMKTMAGQNKKVIEKAVNKATAKYFSKLKKSKNPQHILKQKADALIVNVNSQLWCPNDQGWWDEECQQKFDEVELLAAMWEINLLKAPQNFGKLYPAVCKKYFDFLAKKRFNSTKESEDKNTAEKVKKSKSALQRKFEEKKAQNTDSKKTDKDILKDVLDEMNKKEKDVNLKNLKKFWKPTHKPWSDKECSDAYEKISEQATKMGFDLDTKAGDFKKFKTKNKEECSKYFKLLESKRTAFNAKQKTKLEEKAAPVKEETVEDDATNNKKTKFSDDGLEIPEETPKKKIKVVETEADADETIQQVEQELKKERRKEAKLAKKLKLKALKEAEALKALEETKEVDNGDLEETKEVENGDLEETKEVENGDLETAEETPIKKPKKNKKSRNEVLVVEDVSEALEDSVVKKSKKKKSKDETVDSISDVVLDVSSVKKSKKKSKE